MNPIDFDQLPITPWKNGGGITRELACQPTGTDFNSFLWRASVADITESGPFSAFPDKDRIIVLLEGDGVDLEFDNGTQHALRMPFAPFRFSGDESLYASLAGKPSRDFNLMFRRDVVDGAVEVWREAHDVDSEFPLFFCISGCWEFSDADGVLHRLQSKQALAGGCSSAVVRPLEQGSVLLAIRITPLSSPEKDDS